MLKIVVDRDVRSSGSQRKGEEGKDMGSPVMASGEAEAQPTRSYTFLHQCNAGRGNPGTEDSIFSPL